LRRRLFGFAFCVSIWATGSAWWAIGCHAAWDWAETYFYGTADSGLPAKGHYLTTTPAGAAIWSGGFGRSRGQFAGDCGCAAAFVVPGGVWPQEACGQLQRPSLSRSANRQPDRPMRLWLNRTGEVSLREQLVRR